MSDQPQQPIDDPKPDPALAPAQPDAIDENAPAAAEPDVSQPVAAKTAEPAEPIAEEPAVEEAEAEKSAAVQHAADEAVLADSRRHTRRSFVTAAVGAAAGYGFYRWIAGSPGDQMQPQPFRRAFETNAAIARGITGDRALAPTYALKDAGDLRVNGVYGLKRMLAPDSWRLQLVGAAAGPQHPRFAHNVTAWDYRYAEAGTHEDQGHDTKVDPNAKTAEKMAPAAMMDQAKACPAVARKQARAAAR
jgi:hypothetical protein